MVKSIHHLKQNIHKTYTKPNIYQMAKFLSATQYVFTLKPTKLNM